jgi:hypothetical protein
MKVMQHITAEDVDTFLVDHNIVIRAIPGEVWILSLDLSNRLIPRYVLTEESSNRMMAPGYQARVYRYKDLTAVLLSFLCDPALKQEARNAKYEEKYPIEEGSNVVRLGAWQRENYERDDHARAESESE